MRTQSPPDGPATPATTIALDHLRILLDALAARGQRYEVLVQVATFDAELPSAFGFDVRHTDREVILARVDGRLPELDVGNAQAGIFSDNCVVPSAVGSLTFRRGWAAIDVRWRRQAFRFVSTHLEGACGPATAAIQQAQVADLLGGPASTALPLVLVGDLNSPGDGTGVAYNRLVAAGLADAAVTTGLGNAPTCCQAPQLSNPASLADRRIDVVLTRGGFKAIGATLVGETAADRTATGLWPSDHAGMVVRLRLSRRLTEREAAMDVLEAIHGRRSVRAYTADPLPRVLVEDLLWDAAQAPSPPQSGDLPWTAVIIEGRERLAGLGAEALAYARRHRGPTAEWDWCERPGFKVFWDAPVAVLLCAHAGPTNETAFDCCRAGQTLLLAASARGLGSCWVGAPMPWLRSAGVAESLGVPAGFVPSAAIVLGHAAETPAARPRPRPPIHWSIDRIEGEQP